MLKLKIIACDVLNREISYLTSKSDCFTDTTYLHQGLHNTPDKLRKMLQMEIEKANEGFPYNHHGIVPDYDYIVLGYGLCSNGVVGLTNSKVPMVVPRGHDCITLLLGSKERYRECFDQNPGTYWYSAGWIERSCQPCEERYKFAYDKYARKYGEDNAEYLMGMEQGWLKDYSRAALIKWDILGNMEKYKNFTQESAAFLNWNYKEFTGDHSLMERILNGIFDEKEVLIVPPGKTIAQSYDDNIIKVE